MVRRFDDGDVVRIISPEEYRRRGGLFTNGCGFVLYAGSICEIAGGTQGGGYRLHPIEKKMNIEYDPKHHWDIESYGWGEQQLEPCEDPRGYVDETDFCDIF